MFDYKDKVVIVTGASRGLGRELCLELARRGARLALCSRSEKDLIKLAEEVREFGHEVKYWALSITDIDEVKEFVGKVVMEFGRIDVLVNNAGVATPVKFLELSSDHIRKELDVNYLAPLYLMREVVPLLVKQNSGQIINISSISAILPFPFLTSYSACKAALAVFTIALRTDLNDIDVDFITVFPGKMDTGFHREELSGRGVNKSVGGAGLKAAVAAKRILVATGKRKTTVHTGFMGRLIHLVQPILGPILECLLHRAKMR